MQSASQAQLLGVVLKYNDKKCDYKKEQDRQYAYNITLRCAVVTIVAVEKQ
jgi:hypothetical protein